MANTLTGLINYIYESVDVVSREMVGMIPSVFINNKAEEVAVNQEITYDVVPTMAAVDTIPAATPPALTDTTVGVGTMKLTKSKTVWFHWTGEDEVSIGTKKNAIENNKFAQAMRTITNAIEADLAALYPAASRAYGTAGTTPFGTAGDFTDAAQVVKILKDNGAPTGDIQLVLNTAAGATMIGKQSRADIIGQANIGSIQQQGILLNIAGCKIRESAKIVQHTKGAGVGYDFIAAGEGIGQTVLSVEGGTVNGTGIKAGDIITHAGDAANQYVVNTGLTEVSGDIVIGAPGLLVAGADANEISIGGSYAANMCFDRSAIHLLCRLPKLPSGGDQASDEYILIDPVSGIPFRIAMYKGYMATQIAVQAAWGVKAVKSEHIAILLG